LFEEEQLMPLCSRTGRRAGRRPFRLLAGLVALVALLAGACGGNDTSTGATGGSEAPSAPVKVKVGILPIADVAPFWYGIDKGFFKAENLEVELVPAQGGAAIVPSVMSGEFQFGFSNVVSLMLAREKGNNIQIVSNMVNGSDSKDKHGANAILAGPGVGSLNDLAGKRFAVNTQKNAGEVTIKATLRNAGVDISGISFVEFPFPNMNDALSKGQVDAVWQAEPFVTLGQDNGLKFIADPMFGTMPNLTIASVFASEDYLKEHADVATRFKRAVDQSVNEAAKDEAGMRQTIGKNTKTPPDVLPRMALPVWRTELNMPSIELQAKLAKEFAILEEDVDTSALVWKP
jgi:NitT/TauT family transport system substrate-binding protein